MQKCLKVTIAAIIGIASMATVESLSIKRRVLSDMTDWWSADSAESDEAVGTASHLLAITKNVARAECDAVAAIEARLGDAKQIKNISFANKIRSNLPASQQTQYDDLGDLIISTREEAQRISTSIADLLRSVSNEYTQVCLSKTHDVKIQESQIEDFTNKYHTVMRRYRNAGERIKTAINELKLLQAPFLKERERQRASASRKKNTLRPATATSVEFAPRGRYGDSAFSAPLPRAAPLVSTRGPRLAPLARTAVVAAELARQNAGEVAPLSSPSPLAQLPLSAEKPAASTNVEAEISSVPPKIEHLLATGQRDETTASTDSSPAPSEHGYGDAAPSLGETVAVAASSRPATATATGSKNWSSNKVGPAPVPVTGRGASKGNSKKSVTSRPGSAASVRPRVSASSSLVSKGAEFGNLARAMLFGTRQVTVERAADAEDEAAILAGLTNEQRREREEKLAQQAHVINTTELRLQAEAGRARMDSVRSFAKVLRSGAIATRQRQDAADKAVQQKLYIERNLKRLQREEQRKAARDARKGRVAPMAM